MAPRLLVLFLIGTLTCVSKAKQEYLAKIPNGDAYSRPGSGIECQYLGHTPCLPGEDNNQFGKDFKNNNYIWDKKLCEMDSDGDGVTNGQELGDPCCEWSENRLAEVRQDGLSHPGDKELDAAKDAPGCEPSEPESPPPPPPPASTPASDSEQTATSSPTEADSPADDVTPVPADPEIAPSVSPSTQAPPAVVSPDPTPQPSDDGVCFPAQATVKLDTGVVKTMRDLEIGDRVQVGRDMYSDVFMFTHKMKDVMHEFVSIQVGTNEQVTFTITLTRGHYLYVNGKLTTAGSVSNGDELELASGEKAKVVDVTCAVHKGLYNPQTTHGDLIVDSVRVSTYTTAVQMGMAHSLLAPLRLLYRLVGWTTSAFDAGADRIIAILP